MVGKKAIKWTSIKHEKNKEIYWEGTFYNLKKQLKTKGNNAFKIVREHIRKQR